MPTCKNDPSKKYKGTEPSPKGIGWCAHGEKEGKVRKGKDGNQWVVKKVKNGSMRWMKKSAVESGKMYKIYCEGTASPDLFLQKRKKELLFYTKKDDEYKLIKKVNKYNKILFGRDSTCKSYINSVIVHLYGDRYLFACGQLFEFNIRKNDRIIKFVSSYHTRLYPYPIMIGEQYIYFPDSYKYVPKNKFIDFPKKYNWEMDAFDRLHSMNQFKDYKHISANKLSKMSKIIYV